MVPRLRDALIERGWEPAEESPWLTWRGFAEVPEGLEHRRWFVELVEARSVHEAGVRTLEEQMTLERYDAA